MNFGWYSACPPEIVERALPFVTIYSEMAEINVLDAAPQVVAALPDMTPLRLAAVFEPACLPAAGSAGGCRRALGGKQAGVTVIGSEAYRVRMRITFPDGRQRTPEGVIIDIGGRCEGGLSGAGMAGRD